MFEKLSPDAIRVVMYAQEEARRHAGNVMGTEHLLLGLLREGGRLNRVLKGLTYDQFLARVKSDTPPVAASPELTYDPQTRQALELSEDEAHRLGNQLVHPEHLLLGLLDLGEGKAVRFLEDSGFTLARLRWTALRLRREESATDVLTPTLDQYAEDLTATLTEHGGGLVGRDALISSVIERLGTQGGRLPVLVAERHPDALFDGVARHLVEGRIFDRFLAHRVVRLDAFKLRGMAVDSDALRQILLAMLTEADRAGDVILALSDLPSLILDAYDDKARVMSDVLALWLQAEPRSVMASTDAAGWERLNSRLAWRERLVPISVPPATQQETISILREWRTPIGRHHDVRIEDAVLAAVAQKAQGPLPESAIDLLDLLAARKAFQKTTSVIRLRELERQLRRLKEERDLLTAQAEVSPEAIHALREQAEACEIEIRRLHPHIPAQGESALLTVQDLAHD